MHERKLLLLWSATRFIMLYSSWEKENVTSTFSPTLFTFCFGFGIECLFFILYHLLFIIHASNTSASFHAPVVMPAAFAYILTHFYSPNFSFISSKVLINFCFRLLSPSTLIGMHRSSILS